MQLARSAVIQLQRELCRRVGAEWVEAPLDQRVGIASNLHEGAEPINGLRHPPERGSAGWYLWAGEGGPGTDADYFDALHVAHLSQRCLAVLPYLGLAPGWRFLIARNYEDVWFDAAMLDV